MKNGFGTNHEFDALGNLAGFDFGGSSFGRGFDNRTCRRDFPGDHFDSRTDAHVFAENAHDFGGARAFGRLDVRDAARLYDRAFWTNSRARAIGYTGMGYRCWTMF